MGKKVKEYKAGDFIFAKVKGYPAWPARVQRLNGKKYFVYFYGTGETANLPPNMIFDYAENKDKFLNKTQKRRDFNDGVKQIQYDFANNVPLEDVIGTPSEVGAEVPTKEPADDAADDTMDETVDITANDTNDTIANDASDDTIINLTNEGTVEDSDETCVLVIDEGKAAKKKGKPDVKTPAKDTPKAKEAKSPRGKAKKADNKEDEDRVDEDEEKGDEEIVSRSGRKIRPKRFVDEQTEENSTLPSPVAKRKRVATPPAEKEQEPEPKDKNIKCFNAVTQTELEELKQPFKPEDAEKENILIAYLPSGRYVGIKLFQARPSRFRNEASRLQWDKQAASNAITLRMQLERGQITATSIQGQLVMDLNLTDEEKAILDTERDTECKKTRVLFLKTEMRLIELDSQIKTCLSLEKADADLCLQLMTEMSSLDVKPVMLLKHPTVVETVKRLRAYVGNTSSWDLSESAAVQFTKQAHRIRKQADAIYKNMKDMFTTPDGISFWEFFSERIVQFKKASVHLDSSAILELMQEPIEMTQPCAHTMRAAYEAADDDGPDADTPRKKTPLARPKKTANNNTPIKAKRQSARKPADAVVEENRAEEPIEEAGTDAVDNAKEPDSSAPIATGEVDNANATKDPEEPAVNDKEPAVNDKEPAVNDKEPTVNDKEQVPKESTSDKKNKTPKEGKKSLRNIEKNIKDAEKSAKVVEKAAMGVEKEDNVEKRAKDAGTGAKDANIEATDANIEARDANIEAKEADKDANSDETNDKAAEPEIISENADSSSKHDEVSSKDANTPENDKLVKDNETSSKDDSTTKDVEIEPDSNDKRVESPKKVTKDREKSFKQDKNPEKSTDEADKSTEEAEKSTENIEKGPEEAEQKGKSSNKKEDKKKADKNSKEDKSKEKAKDGDKRRSDDDKTKEDCEPRAKRSRETRESKKTEVQPPRSPTKRKPKV